MSQIIHADNRYNIFLSFADSNSNISPKRCLINQVI
ncbi:hypothetical protein Xbud_00323 [Xenorhabdus budapestensis]|uniref:Uncharacterized protein n=1 Tax=Xenorhabdus budapestensis TaxID=290110 RepID=A0A2D0J5J6_XENBU|nr:hypothetical protein Xbud_00323 [Xenorhabdus budapestensis]